MVRTPYESATGGEPTSQGSPSGLVVGAALAAVYLIWGSTYLAIRFGLEGFPPFLLSAIRFLIAGGIMYTVLRLRGTPAPSRRHWWNAAIVGALMLAGGVGLVTVAEDLGVGSAVTATAVAVIPLWVALVSGLFGRWPIRLEWVGLIVGFVGVLVLAQEGDFVSNPAGLIVLAIAPILWSIGSVWGSHMDLPRPAMATATQLLAGGALLALLGLVSGERITEVPSAPAWLALAYLIVFGSIVAFTAYVYLLRTVRPALATSYAYANPVVAVVLGVTLGAEVLTGPAYIALPLILSGVGLAALAPRRLRRERDPLGFEEEGRDVSMDALAADSSEPEE
ncbi:MAG: drug/metabolite exporter YedA [Acidimicrobiia bacterium]|nr:MAG: drug/metabolite exporter YedA [Acidimicrobiia bacterium]